MPVIFPGKYRVLERKGTKWHIKGSKVGSIRNIGLRDLHNYYLDTEKLLIALFRVNGGKLGFYIADLEEKKYYYCGPDGTDVIKKKSRSGYRSPRASTKRNLQSPL